MRYVFDAIIYGRDRARRYAHCRTHGHRWSSRATPIACTVCGRVAQYGRDSGQCLVDTDMH